MRAAVPARRKPKTLLDLLRDLAMRAPDRKIFTFLGPEGREVESLTCGELLSRAQAIAATLESFRAGGERVLLVYPPGLEFIKAFFGCLFGGAIAVPVPFPDEDRPGRGARRLSSVALDAAPALALTTSRGLSFLRSAFADAGELRHLRWLATDLVAPELEHEWWDPGARADAIAYLQYTSGSTSAPKGVVLRHDQVLANSAQIAAAADYDEQSLAAMWLPHYHDTGLVHGVLQPLFTGSSSVLMSPLTFVQQPFRWLEAVSRYRATHSGGPNFAYGLCTRKISREERARLDLSSWRLAYDAAEPVRQETLDGFAEAFAECGFRRASFYPAYGLAEATLLVTVKRRGAELVVHGGGATADGARERPPFVSCGPPVAGTSLRIVRPGSAIPVDPGEEGEIWVSGPGVAEGYWNRPHETEETFRAFVADSGEGPFLRTGDLGFLRNGELFVTGRVKDLVIIRGQNHYPQDIEWTVEGSHAAVRPGCSAAFSVDDGEEERLVIVAELRDGSAGPEAISEIAEAIVRSVADQHALSTHAIWFLPPGTIPKTSSGKIQRHESKTGFLGGTLTRVGVWNADESPN